MTRGIFSGRIEILDQPFLQTDAALNPGVSGGMAVTDMGKVAGLAVAGLAPSAAESVGFLIPASAIKARLAEWLPQLAAGQLELPVTQTLIAFESQRSGDDDIYVMDSDGMNVQQLTDTRATDWEPTWSPDGRQIAFTSDRDGDDEIYVMDANGKNVRQLTVNRGLDRVPAWSPDGRQIAFTSDRDDDDDIYVMDTDGTNVRRLTNLPGSDWSPAWSPNGAQIAFTSDRDGDNDIYIMDADGGNVRQLTNHPGDDLEPAWSPDGTRIAFGSNRDGDLDIYIVDEDGTTIRQLTDEPGWDVLPTWSPDGRQLAFTSDRNGDVDIYVMDADGKNVRQLTNTSGFDYEPAWSPILHPMPSTSRDPTPRATTTPSVPQGTLAWLRDWDIFINKLNQKIATTNKLNSDEVSPENQIEEFQQVIDEARSKDGYYGFVFDPATFLRVPEVRELDDWLKDYVEATFARSIMYVRYLKTGDRALYEQSQALRVDLNKELRHIRNGVFDLKTKYGL